MAEVFLSREAHRQLDKLPDIYAIAVEGAITTLGADPLAGKPLRGRLRGVRALRVGVYRILYEFDARKKVVLIASIRHRGEAYRDAR